LADQHRNRLGILSFYIDGLHYNLGVKMLNDKFGIQTRGGCSCAGTYGHYLLNVSQEDSRNISDMVTSGDCSLKPGWIRLSIHPTHTDEEIHYICNSLKELATKFQDWEDDYNIDLRHGSIQPKESAVIRKMEEDIDNCLMSNFA
jgi:selenocysteine lyase/cysteine desulfurase